MNKWNKSKGMTGEMKLIVNRFIASTIRTFFISYNMLVGDCIYKIVIFLIFGAFFINM